MFVCPLHSLHLYWPHTACKKVVFVVVVFFSFFTKNIVLSTNLLATNIFQVCNGFVIIWSTQDVYRISTIGYRCTIMYNKIIKSNKVPQSPGVLFLTIYTFQRGDRDSVSKLSIFTSYFFQVI